jgi:hypothetical protein
VGQRLTIGAKFFTVAFARKLFDLLRTRLTYFTSCFVPDKAAWRCSSYRDVDVCVVNVCASIGLVTRHVCFRFPSRHETSLLREIEPLNGEERTP